MVAHVVTRPLSDPSFYRSAPLVTRWPSSRVVPGDAPDSNGSAITSVPMGAGAVAASIPTVTGAPVKRGSGTGFSYAEIRDGDALQMGTTEGARDGSTIMMVARLKSTTGTQSLFWNGPAGANRWDLSIFPSGSERLRYVYSTSDSTFATHPWVPDTDWHVFTLTRTSDAVNIGVDLQFKSTTGLTPDRPFPTFRIGQRRNDSGNNSGQEIDVAEAIVFQTNLVGEYRIAEVKNLMSYYKLRWGDDIKP